MGVADHDKESSKWPLNSNANDKAALHILRLFALLALALMSLIEPVGSVYSSRVYPGADGNLNHTRDAEGNRIPDFSFAGYRGGGVELPIVPIVAKVRPILKDNAAHLQAAINAVESLTPDENGFRGALLLEPGDYPISSSLHIRASGVVLRGTGNGTDPSVDTIIRRTGRSKSNVIKIGAGSPHGFSKFSENTTAKIVTNRVLVGDQSFDVEHSQRKVQSRSRI